MVSARSSYRNWEIPEPAQASAESRNGGYEDSDNENVGGVWLTSLSSAMTGARSGVQTRIFGFAMSRQCWSVSSASQMIQRMCWYRRTPRRPHIHINVRVKNASKWENGGRHAEKCRTGSGWGQPLDAGCMPSGRGTDRELTYFGAQC